MSALSRVERQTSELHVLTEVAKTLTAHRPLPELLEGVMNRMAEVLEPAEFGVVLLWNQRKVWGIQLVVLLWYSVEGRWRIPVGFRLWRPKRSCSPQYYRTKLELAMELVTAVVLAELPVDYIAGDIHYTTGWFTKRLARLGLTWHGTLTPKPSSSGEANASRCAIWLSPSS